MTDFVELAELEFRLPPSPDVDGWEKRRIVGTARVEGESNSSRAFVMSLKDGSTSYFVDLQPGSWRMRIELFNQLGIGTAITLAAGEKKIFDLTIDPNWETISFEMHESAVEDEKSSRMRQRAGKVENRGARIGNILDNLIKYDAREPRSAQKFSISKSEVPVEPIFQPQSAGLIAPEITGIRAELGRYYSPEADAESFWSKLNHHINVDRDSALPFAELAGVSSIKVSKSDREIAQVGLPGAEIEGFRSWIEVDINGQRRLLSVPPEWNAVATQDEAVPYSVQMKSRDASAPLARIYVHDPDMYDVMYAMTPTGIGDATIIALEARQWLYDKVNNPVAAAGGGYALLALKIQGKDSQEWFQWLDNLDSHNPWLPDAAILRGTLCMKGPEGIRNFKLARDHFVRAYESGIPYYTLGVTWLQSSLGKLSADYPELEPILYEVSMLARRLDTSAVFTSLRL